MPGTWALMRLTAQWQRQCSPLGVGIWVGGLVGPSARTVVAFLQKLTLLDRVQAVVLAYESGLLQPGEADSVRTS